MAQAARLPRPPQLGVWLWQLPQRSIKFSSRWSFASPFMWCSSRPNGFPRHSSKPHPSHRLLFSPSRSSRDFTCARWRGRPATKSSSIGVTPGHVSHGKAGVASAGGERCPLASPLCPLRRMRTRTAAGIRGWCGHRRSAAEWQANRKVRSAFWHPGSPGRAHDASQSSRRSPALLQPPDAPSRLREVPERDLGLRTPRCMVDAVHVHYSRDRTLRGRLMARRRSLESVIGVRVPAPQLPHSSKATCVRRRNCPANRLFV